jgi:hypothetical protein
VRLRTLGGRAVLTIADDGRGFDVPEDLGELSGGLHFGVLGMRERAQLAGGDLEVESAPGEGCVLSVWVPLEPPAACSSTTTRSSAAASRACWTRAPTSRSSGRRRTGARRSPAPPRCAPTWSASTSACR